jgi:capsular exopolysaccharide synthesis family protein
LELRDYLRVLRKGWALILAFVIVGIALGVGLTIATTKLYEASAQVFVSANSVSSLPDAASGNSLLVSQVQSFVSIADAPSVTGPVIAALKLPYTSPKLAGKITADAPANKVLINLHVTDTDPARAAKIANALANQFDVVVEASERPDGSTTSLVKLTLTKPATIPSAPVSPRKILNIGLGFVLGLLIGIGVAVLREVLDTTVKNGHDFEALGVPMLGNVPFDKRTSKTPVAFRGDLHSARSEAYRQIRTNLQFVDVDNPPRIIAVTSAIPGEGKSTSAINLAAALAEAGARVCLIEADLRRPSIARVLGLVGDVGFTTVVIGKAPVETVLQNAGRNLAVLTSGPIPPNPSELLLSRHAKQVILDIAAKVDFTIIDTPPLLPVTDGAEIATLADATILVHRAGKTTRDQVTRSVEALAKVGTKPVGVILNMITRSAGKYDYEYGYYYESYRPGTDSKGRIRKTEKGAENHEPPVGTAYEDSDSKPSVTAEEPAPQHGLFEAPTADTAAAETRIAILATPPAGTPSVRNVGREDDASPASEEKPGRKNRRRGRRGGDTYQVPPRSTPSAYELPAMPDSRQPRRSALPQNVGDVRFPEPPNDPRTAPIGGPFAGPVMPRSAPIQTPTFGPVPVPSAPASQPPANFGYAYPQDGAEGDAPQDVEVDAEAEPQPTPLWFRNDQPRL